MIKNNKLPLPNQLIAELANTLPFNIHWSTTRISRAYDDFCFKQTVKLIKIFN